MTRKILVVDDEPAVDLLMRQIFRKEIRQGSYSITFAKDGFAALEKLESIPGIGVVLTDINMPGMDGMTLLARVQERFPRVRVIMVSAYNDPEKIEASMKKGAYDFINKPIKVQEIKELIHGACHNDET